MPYLFKILFVLKNQGERERANRRKNEIFYLLAQLPNSAMDEVGPGHQSFFGVSHVDSGLQALGSSFPVFPGTLEGICFGNDQLVLKLVPNGCTFTLGTVELRMPQCQYLHTNIRGLII